jgi:nucleoid-associated protein YgaU
MDVAVTDLEQDAGEAPAETGTDEGTVVPEAPEPSEPKPAGVAPDAPAPLAEALPVPAAPAAPSETAAEVPVAVMQGLEPTAAAPEAAAAAPVAAPDTNAVGSAKRHQRFMRAKHARRVKAARHPSAPTSASVTPAIAVPDAAPATALPVRTRSVASAQAPASEGRAARRGDDVHVVLRGESLWSIAGDLLGDGASPARVAREVNRLWQLNDDRIGTGDRDLLMAGTKLELT